MEVSPNLNTIMLSGAVTGVVCVLDHTQVDFHYVSISLPLHDLSTYMECVFIQIILYIYLELSVFGGSNNPISAPIPPEMRAFSMCYSTSVQGLCHFEPSLLSCPW